jgi:hypothetical protein
MAITAIPRTRAADDDRRHHQILQFEMAVRLWQALFGGSRHAAAIR